MRQPIVAAGLTRLFPSGAGGGTPVAAVVDATFTVGENELLGVVGPNGAGKTTLLEVLATVLTPTSGSVTLLGLDAVRDPLSVRRQIGYVPAGGRALYPRLTVLQNLKFFAALCGDGACEATDRVNAVLQRCGATTVSNTRVDRLSDGFVARVSLARALLGHPAILLLDEPARSIDPINRPALLRTIREFVNQPGKAAVLVTHDVGDVSDICDRVAVMRCGRIDAVQQVAGAAGGARLRIPLAGQAK